MRFVALSLMAAVTAAAADWPQWGGPNRNFQLTTTVEVSAWPESGPREVWNRELGDGYSALAVSDGVLYTMYRKGAQDVVIALDPDTGETVWETAIDAPHRDGMNIEAGPGPHSTPLIAGDRIFVTTVLAHLAALDRETGKRLWVQDLWTEHQGNFLDRGYAASPIAYEGNVIVPVGGEDRALMAFRQSDGSVVWSEGDFDNSYSSPILIHAGGLDQIVSFMAKHVMGAAAATGEVLWSVEHETMYDINAATPTWCEDAGVLVVSSAYDGGARGIQVSETAEELWHQNRLRVHHGNMVCDGGVVYGSSGDFGPAPLTALEAKTGEILWQDRAFSKAAFVMAGDRLFATDDDGSVGIARVSREGVEVVAEAQLLRANSWTVPTVWGGRMFVRDRHRVLALELE